MHTDINIRACLEDAMFRISSSTNTTGTYYLTSSNCSYEIGITASGLKTVTTTASTTSGVGYWQDTVVTQVNVSSTPIRIESQSKSNQTYDSYEYYFFRR